MNRLNNTKNEIINGPNPLEETQMLSFHNHPILPSLDEDENYEMEVKKSISYNL